MLFFVLVEIEQLLIPHAFPNVIAELCLSQFFDLGFDPAELELVLAQGLGQSRTGLLEGDFAEGFFVGFAI